MSTHSGFSSDAVAETPGDSNGDRRGENGCRNGKHQPNYDATMITKFKGTVESLACFGTNEEKKGDSFITFQKKLHEFLFGQLTPHK